MAVQQRGLPALTDLITRRLVRNITERGQEIGIIILTLCYTIATCIMIDFERFNSFWDALCNLALYPSNSQLMLRVKVALFSVVSLVEGYKIKQSPRYLPAGSQPGYFLSSSSVAGARRPSQQVAGYLRLYLRRCFLSS